MATIWPFRHLGLKALSVVLALLLWMIVSGEEMVERGLRVPLELQQAPVGLELTGDGRPAPGYVVGALSADPKTVEVIGPESAVRRVTEALTEPVSVSGARDRVNQSVILGLIDPSLRLKNTRSAMVTVQIVPAPL